MKIVTKIASFTLLMLGLQIDAAQQYSPGVEGLVTTCKVFTRTGNFKISGPASTQFQQAYGLDAKEVCTPSMITKIQAIQQFVNDPANFNGGTFTSPSAAGDFVNLIGDSANLFSGPLFPTFGGLSYWDLAKNQLEAELTTQTSSAQKLVPIAENLNEVVPTTRGMIGTAPLDTAQIRKLSKNVSDDLKGGLDVLNSLQLTWNTTTQEYEATAIARKDLNRYHPGPLSNYIQTTFTKHLQFLVMPQPTLLPLIATAPPLDTSLLNPVTTPNPTDFKATEAQANEVIEAMEAQIKGTDGELIRVAALAPAFTLPNNDTLQARATALLDYLSGGGGTAGIQAYLDSHSTGAWHSAFQSVIDTTRTALEYPIHSRDQYEAIQHIFNPTPSTPLGPNSTELNVKLAIDYLTTQLYTSFMWLTKDKNAGVRIPGVPVYASGPATDVAAATKNRIEALIATIETLHADNEVLTQAKPGTTITKAAETDKDVLGAARAAQALAGQLTPCRNLITTAGTVDLGKFQTATQEMAAALTNLTTGMAAPASAANGVALATAIKTKIETAAKASVTAGFTQVEVEAEVKKATDLLNKKLQEAQDATAAETAKLAALPRKIAANLVSDKGGAQFEAFSGGTFKLADLTLDAPTAASTLKEVGDYFRECAEAAALLKALAGSIGMPTAQINTMQDLIIKSGRAIRSMLISTPAPAAAAAAIDKAIVTGHNTSVNFIVALFNASTNLKVKLGYTALFGPLNAAADAINATKPATKALTITQTDNTVTLASQATFK
jgi:hypothetical protein